MKLNGLGSITDGGKSIVEELVRFQRFEGIEGKANKWLYSLVPKLQLGNAGFRRSSASAP